MPKHPENQGGLPENADLSARRRMILLEQDILFVKLRAIFPRILQVMKFRIGASIVFSLLFSLHLCAQDNNPPDSIVSAASLPRGKLLTKLTVNGLTLNAPDVVNNNLMLHTGSRFTATDVKESVRKLSGLGLFRTVDVFVEAETDSTAALLFKVEEYPLCEAIEFAGLKKIKQKDIEEKFPVRRGQVASDNAVFRAQEAIKEQCAKKGFLLAEVSVDRIASKVPGNVILKFVVKEGPKVQIRHIAFKGNRAFTEGKLRGKFKTKLHHWWGGGDFDEELYRSHLDSLIMFYNDEGYLDASIVGDSVWYSESKTDLGIAITLEEGRRYYTGKFSFVGNVVVPADSLLSKMLLKEGKPFAKDRFDMSKYLVENAYREEGYLWVQVEEQRQFRGDTVDVAFSITEGKPAIVRKIVIKGNTKTREKVIRREIDLLPGQRYRQSLMLSSRQRVMALNFFSDCKPDLLPNSDGTIDLIFDVVEKDNIGTFQIGAAYSQIDNLTGTVSLGIPNFRGAGEDMKINLQYGIYSKGIDLSFMEPWAFDSPTSLSAGIFAHQSIPYYYMLSSAGTHTDTVTSYGFRVGAGRSKLSWPDNHFSINGSYEFSYQMSPYLADSTDRTKLFVPKSGFLSRLSIDIMRYDLDMPQFPTTGSKLIISPEIGGLGGDFKYLKGVVNYGHYFPLPLKLVLGSNSKIGLISPLGDGPVKIPRLDLFKSGGVYGDADLRGYPDYAFGGYSSYFTAPYGLAMFASTIEIRYPLLEQQLYIGTFADVGNTWNGLARIDLGDLYKGFGFGIRLNIPMMGLMGFDFGYGFDDLWKRTKMDGGKPNGWQMHFLMNRGF
jgi:outer membrane protein insertion porin family